MLATHAKLPVLSTADESWRFLLRRPQATLLTMVVAALWLHAVLRAATLLSYTPGVLAPGAGPDGGAVSLLPFAVSGIFALAGRLIVAALVMVYWARTAGGPTAVPEWPDWRTLSRAVGLSAIMLAALGVLWVVSFLLIGLPFGARPMMVTVNVTPLGTFADEPAVRFLDPKLLLVLGTCIVAALVPVRLALALPAVAQGSKLGVRNVWALGSGNGWRLLATVLIVLSPVWLAGMVVDPPPHVPPGDRDWIWWTRNELDRSLNGLQFALAGIVLALCYRVRGRTDKSGNNDG